MTKCKDWQNPVQLVARRKIGRLPKAPMRVRLRSSAIDSYKVAADRPRLITIAAIGAALIDGHDIGATSNGVFAKLGNLKPGQMIAIVNNYLKVIRQGKKIAQDHRIIVRADLAK